METPKISKCICGRPGADFRSFHSHADQKDIGCFLCEICFTKYPTLRRFYHSFQILDILANENLDFREG